MIDKAVRKAYTNQIAHCKYKLDALGNPVKMRMSLQQFADIWDQSGHWDQRGRKKDEYCMARHNDIGHYEVGNVKIITNAENVSEAQKSRPSPNKGKPSPLKGRPSPNKGRPSPKKGIPRSIETKDKISAKRKGIPKPKIQCPHCGTVVGGHALFKRWHGDNCKAAPK